MQNEDHKLCSARIVHIAAFIHYGRIFSYLFLDNIYRLLLCSIQFIDFYTKRRMRRGESVRQVRSSTAASGKKECFPIQNSSARTNNKSTQHDLCRDCREISSLWYKKRITCASGQRKESDERECVLHSRDLFIVRRRLASPQVDCTGWNCIWNSPAAAAKQTWNISPLAFLLALDFPSCEALSLCCNVNLQSVKLFLLTLNIEQPNYNCDSILFFTLSEFVIVTASCKSRILIY